MTALISVKQAFELGRLADRHGPLAVRPLSGGHVAVGIFVGQEGTAKVALALDGTGRVAAYRQLRGEGTSTC